MNQVDESTRKVTKMESKTEDIIKQATIEIVHHHKLSDTTALEHNSKT